MGGKVPEVCVLLRNGCYYRKADKPRRGIWFEILSGFKFQGDKYLWLGQRELKKEKLWCTVTKKKKLIGTLHSYALYCSDCLYLGQCVIKASKLTCIVYCPLTNLLQRTFTKFFNRHGLIVVKYGATWFQFLIKLEDPWHHGNQLLQLLVFLKRNLI